MGPLVNGDLSELWCLISSCLLYTSDRTVKSSIFVHADGGLIDDYADIEREVDVWLVHCPLFDRSVSLNKTRERMMVRMACGAYHNSLSSCLGAKK